MKRILVCLLALMLVVCMILPTSAQESAMQIVSETTEYTDDGSYIVTTVYEGISSNEIARAGYNKTGSKTVTHYGSDNSVNWTFTVTGTFVVNEGVVSACTTARYSYTTPDSAWSLKSGNAAKTGNQAVGSATFVRKVLGVTVDTEDVTCTLTCDKYGVLS